MTKDDDMSDSETAGEAAADDGRTDAGAGTETVRKGETTEDIVHRQGEDSSDEPES
jgi:hypothetical protein